ncbi:hypothetical protein DPEC_G00020430 [Dallia pectoralis]|uniref:Uncharacterized protein n=1 Tax=Dallia pectoralis TaxID=75939 RepID=A0ACC2HGS1_DALPE|nr:hypothetical protein DPEC_G00020430 [Dallia pectoralis]
MPCVRTEQEFHPSECWVTTTTSHTSSALVSGPTDRVGSLEGFLLGDWCHRKPVLGFSPANQRSGGEGQPEAGDRLTMSGFLQSHNLVISVILGGVRP